MSYYNQKIMNRMNRNEGEPFYQNNNDNKSNNNNNNNLYINKKNYDTNYNVNNNMHIPNNPFQNNDYSSNIEGINKIDTNIMNNNFIIFLFFFFFCRSKKGYCISFFCILWSALTASRFFEVVII
ncbi:hypothetical protein PFMALIP_05569 [Plasmodium falciparum MaliPS096_E11]|uniref:Uncharacterized protein n=1 Tax=Plasmodium falciparum MaliPS096_E11 TaxID=1036727 RepID=A0A024WIH2_PLAFA|nr:hypothetical protein PFMALIP_05569 [Plasmodium falciparum MaliPS096_E11]